MHKMLYPSSYPPTPPGQLPPTYAPYAVRRLPEPQPLPMPSVLPPLPSPPRESPFPGWTLTTHLTPSAYPRASPTATKRSIRPPYPPIPDSKTKEQRREETERLLFSMRKQREQTTQQPSWVDPRPSTSEPRLWNTINRFTRASPLPHSGNKKEGQTLFFAHANGFPKEMWEPVIAFLLEGENGRWAEGVQEIWVWETANHGDAALINAPNLGDTFDWADNARDVLQFLVHHLPAPSSPAPLHLPPHPPNPSQGRIIGIGHSLGGGTLTRAALAQPELFEALILVDPVIIREHIYSRREAELKRFDALVRGALARRSTWGSREEAKQAFLKSPFFQAWHPAVLAAYIEHGLTPLPSGSSEREGGVMLKQHPYDEASLFCEPRAQAETWFLLPLLPKRIELRWVMNGKTHAEATGGEEETRWTVWRREGNTSNVRVGESGHLIAQEAPERLAREVGEVLMRRWRADGERGVKGKL